MQTTPNHHVFTHFDLFVGMGGMSLGLSKGQARIGNTRATMQCVGGVDVWPVAIANFEKLTGARGTVLDLFDRADYIAFHGKEPPADWREATVDDIRRAAGGVFPDFIATSPPCQGYSGLIDNESAAAEKYQALNRLTLRGVALCLAAFADNPPSMFLLENVPRIQTRGRDLLDTLTQLLRAHGYAVAETTHDCGELGGLSQHRQRFLLVARHTRKVRPFLYEPPRRRVRSIGEALAQLPMPGAALGGATHRLPALQWKTWMRLALIRAGGDWRSLMELEVVDGYLRDFCLVPAEAAWYRGCMGVRDWSDASGAVTSRSGPTNGAFSVADPRSDSETARFNNVLRLARWSEASPAVTGGAGPTAGGVNVADPRGQKLGEHSGKMHVQRWQDASRTVTGTADIQSGAHAVADPRQLPAPDAKLDPAPVIIATDGTWHRPLTTLELAHLQGYPVFGADGAPLVLHGKSVAVWRKQIGNSVPVGTAQAIGNVVATTLLLEVEGESFVLSPDPVWVDGLRTAIAVASEVA